MLVAQLLIAMANNGTENWVNVDKMLDIRRLVTLKRMICVHGHKIVAMIFHGCEEADGIHLKKLNLDQNTTTR